MGCNFSNSLMKRCWEKDEAANALPVASIGFATGCSMAKEFWCQTTRTQTNIWLEWLNPKRGFLLDDEVSPFDIHKWSTQWNVAAPARKISFTLDGFNEVQPFGPGPEGTVAATIRVDYLVIEDEDVIEWREVSFINAVWPNPRRQYTFENFQVVLPLPGLTSKIIGGFGVWPLRRCHTCTTDPDVP